MIKNASTYVTYSRSTTTVDENDDNGNDECPGDEKQQMENL